MKLKEMGIELKFKSIKINNYFFGFKAHFKFK